MTKPPLNRKKFFWLAFAAAAVFSIFYFLDSKFSVFAFTGPSTSAGVGSGAISTDAAGNVGIGTPVPGFSAGGGLEIQRSTRPTLRLEQDAGSLTGVEIYADGNGLNFENMNGSRHFIFTTGNVGIGTTTPAYALSVNGTIYSASGGIRFPDNTVQTTALGPSTIVSAANVQSGDFGANTGGGNYSFPASVGIGTTQPSSTLHVVQGGALRVGNTTFYASSTTGHVGIGTDRKSVV